ncbi:hypothetical protein EYF80_013691 [Liparis tanakae]|uniref:Uncharacterized protein n=1 Tax=Liparis tanakae TaxID=230148 RepID=A0A4Z2IDW9_9TELE|nr:hypothetical protein EYF80_013691 [Liparis tanakae]
MVISSMVMMRSCTGLVLPRTAPKEIRTVAVLKCQRPCMRRPHCRPKAARSKLMPTLLNPYLFRNVIRNPKPMKIMTWTSWNTGDMRREVTSAAWFEQSIEDGEDVKLERSHRVWHHAQMLGNTRSSPEGLAEPGGEPENPLRTDCQADA